MAVRRHRVRTLLTGVAAVLVLTTAIPAVPATAADPPTRSRSDAAAGWLARQLVDGERFEAVFDGTAYPDQGLTLDAVFAFAAAKVADTNAGRAMGWLARPQILGAYVGDGTTEAYAGATAKLALAVQVRGGDPAAFGGVDLTGRLRGLLAASGRFSDRSQFGDFSNAFTQSFALLTLDRSTGGAPAAGVAYLVGTRCADGGFPAGFEQPTCVSDVDATAMAVLALLAVDRPGDAAPAVAWLLSAQAGDGSFTEATGVPNANSTAVAAQALSAAGRFAGWLRAHRYLTGLQQGCAAPAADRGAVAYSAGGFDPSTAARATAQAVVGLTAANPATLTSRGSRPANPVLACR